MKKIIKVTKGTGTGATHLAAFDHALQVAGIANYNLITLSSVIPPGHVIELGRPEKKTDEFGHKLYVVLAEERVDELGKEAWAGLGWVMRKTESGGPASPERSAGGLFVEHHGHSEEEVKNLITASLESMKERREEEYGEINYEIAGTECVLDPVCALVAAVYESVGWS